jgi:hypothetical protein
VVRPQFEIGTQFGIRQFAIQIAPAKEGGLWWIGALSPEAYDSPIHEETVKQKLKAIQDEIDSFNDD